ncbi:hypothetical protein ABLE94_20855 [Gordonia sp. VNK1]|uniref:hypothetical protein n=1 Tax=Gordonia oleivorans TaxID=3156618 RepID=UPI0032B418DA
MTLPSTATSGESMSNPTPGEQPGGGHPEWTPTPLGHSTSPEPDWQPPGYGAGSPPQFAWPEAAGPGSSGGGPPGGSGRALAIIIGVIVLVVTAIVGVGVVAAHLFTGEGGEAAPAPSSSHTTSVALSTPPPPTCPGAVTTAATPSGWQPVAGKRGLSYDVPGNWQVLGCGTLVGWEKRCDDGPFGYCAIRTMGGAAELEVSRCPNNSAGLSGTPAASGTDDITTAVSDEAALVADIYTSDSGVVPTVTLSGPRPLTVSGAPAVQIVATVTGIETSACVGPSAIHSIVATTVPGQSGTVLFVISLPQGGPDAADPSLIDTMVGTLRRSS